MTAPDIVQKDQPLTAHHVIVRLERNNRELLDLSNRLRSYKCEPKTYSLFERLEEIRDHLENLAGSNREVIDILGADRKSLDEHFNRIIWQLREFKELKGSVLEYIGMAKLHT